MFAIRRIEPQTRALTGGQFPNQGCLHRKNPGEIHEHEVALAARHAAAIQDVKRGMPSLARFFPAGPFPEHAMVGQFTKGIRRAKEDFFAVAASIRAESQIA